MLCLVIIYKGERLLQRAVCVEFLGGSQWLQRRGLLQGVSSDL
jgi:hypothetical protein